MGLSVILGALGRVPAWAWVLAGLLAWGGWHRWQAIQARQEFAGARQAAEVQHANAVAAAASESARRAGRMQEITDAETIRRQAAEVDRDRARSAAERLRGQLAAAQAHFGAGHPSAADGGQAAAPADGVLAELLGQCGDRVRALAAEADATRGAGAACERAYDALTVD